MAQSSKKTSPPPLPGAGSSKPSSPASSGAEELKENGAMVVQVGDDDEVELEESTLPPTQEDSYRSVKKNRKFGRYELLMNMSQGGMATLYLARISGPEGFEKLLAIKRIHEHLSHRKEFVKMFLDEARIAARIQHPNVASIYEMGSVEESYFIAMEYVHGQNVTDLLRALIRQKVKLRWPFAAKLVMDAAAGLHAAHELKGPTGEPLNVVHRDVSPQNLLVSYEGHLKVVDFGIAYAAERLVETKTGTLKGKAAYMSPEQACAKPLDRRSDIFSLGIVLHEAVCLKRLFRTDNEAATLLKVRDAEVPSPRSIRAEVPTELEEIILKCLAKEPEDRYSTAGELAEALEEVMVSKGEMISSARLSKMMKRVFYDKKKIKDKQIEQALAGKPLVEIQGAAMGNTTETAMESLTGSLGTGSQGSSKLLVGTIAGAAAAVVAAIAVLIYFIAFRPPSSEAQPGSDEGAGAGAEARNETDKGSKRHRESMEAAGGADARPAKITLKVTVEPLDAKAKIFFRGKEYDGPRFQASVPGSSHMENIKVMAGGFQTETLAVTLDESQTFNVNLRREKKSEEVGGSESTSRPPTRRRRPHRRPARRRRPHRRPGKSLLINDLE